MTRKAEFHPNRDLDLALSFGHECLKSRPMCADYPRFRQTGADTEPCISLYRSVLFTIDQRDCSMASTKNKQSVSFRFDPIVVRRLKDRAAEAGAGQTALAERYIEEGIRRDEHPLIYFRDGEAGRRPALLGSRLDVADVVTTIRQNDGSVEEAASSTWRCRWSWSKPRPATTASTPKRSTS